MRLNTTIMGSCSNKLIISINSCYAAEHRHTWTAWSNVIYFNSQPLRGWTRSACIPSCLGGIFQFTTATRLNTNGVQGIYTRNSISIHNRYAAEHSNTSQNLHHILYTFTKSTPPILNSPHHPPSTNQLSLPILFIIPVRIPQQIHVHLVFAPTFFPRRSNSFQ